MLIIILVYCVCMCVCMINISFCAFIHYKFYPILYIPLLTSFILYIMFLRYIIFFFFFGRPAASGVPGPGMRYVIFNAYSSTFICTPGSYFIVRLYQHFFFQSPVGGYFPLMVYFSFPIKVIMNFLFHIWVHRGKNFY